MRDQVQYLSVLRQESGDEVRALSHAAVGPDLPIRRQLVQGPQASIGNARAANESHGSSNTKHR
jgi:hypothetical protein